MDIEEKNENTTEDKNIVEDKNATEKENNNKKSKVKSIMTAIRNCPKIIKRIFMIFVVAGFFALGLRCNYNFKTESDTLSIEFKNVGELVTQSAFVRVLEDSATNRKIFEKFDIPFTESRKLFSYIVQVDASINFEEISTDTNDETKTVKVKLPHSKVYNSTPDLNSFKSYIDSESMFSRIDSEKYNDALKELTNQGEKDAVENGLLEKADENGKTLIESFIKSNEKYKDYSIEFEYIEGEN